MGGNMRVRIWFTNHRGEYIENRLMLPIPGSLRFVSTEWHKEPQWVIDGWDFERDAMRTYAIASILKWLPE